MGATKIDPISQGPQGKSGLGLNVSAEDAHKKKAARGGFFVILFKLSLDHLNDPVS